MNATASHPTPVSLRRVAAQLVVLVVCFLLGLSHAAAQSESIATEQEHETIGSSQPGSEQSAIVVSPPSTDGGHSLALAYEQYPTLDLDLKVRRARIALWSMAGMFVAGLVTFSVGLSQCTEYVTETGTTVRCNGAGEVLEPMGRALMYGGVVGALTSGIMLAVRNKKRREQRTASPRVVPVVQSDR